MRTRMLRVLDLLFDDHADLGPVLRRMHAGTSYRELANTLIRGADLYGAHAALVATVPKHYAATDAADAVRHANDIIHALDKVVSTDASVWATLRRRAATHLLAVYDEVAEAGRFLERADKDGRDHHFPSLIGAGRATPARPAKPPPPAPATPA